MELSNIYFINLKKSSFFSLSKHKSMVPDRGSIVTVVSIHFIPSSDCSKPDCGTQQSDCHRIQSELFTSLQSTSRNKGISCVYSLEAKKGHFTLSFTRKLWSNLTIKWNDLAWNDLTMGRNNSKPSMLLNCPDSREKAPPSSISAALTG